MPQLSLHTPLGEVTLSEEDGAIVALDWGRGRDQLPTPLLRAAREQLQDYFDGRRMLFDLPLAPLGTPYQKRVWAALARIPAGETRSYLDIAREVASVPRAVGQANGRNPIPIIIPCHRVVAHGGALGGYSGGDGAPTKRYLLDHEARFATPPVSRAAPAGQGTLLP
ncbi:MAG: methylated-DNA--[protein]-cysteine S-methyltransferase [Acetobacteraceae bacterium]|nr:methylated-DNA--[protein]-cysteine S-methyltransferase [Acetobacteraceae bacterium]